jgi:predicted ester cyclase
LRGIPPTGKQVVLTGTTTVRIAGGKFVEAYSNWDALGMMQQLGVAEKQRTAGRAAG